MRRNLDWRLRNVDNKRKEIRNKPIKPLFKPIGTEKKKPFTR